jgi:hypothetical protein
VVEARLRVEGWRTLNIRDSGQILERARLGVDLARDALEARVVLQEAASLGAGTDLLGGPVPLAETGAYEIWGAWRVPCAWPTSIRIGLQPIAWGEGRLLGTDDWSVTGRTIHAVRVRTTIRETAIELFAALLTSSPVPAVAAYGELFGARAEVAYSRQLALEVYALARLAQENPVPNLEGTVRGGTYTAAARAYGEIGRWTWGTESAYQFGEVEELHEPRAAFATASHVAHRFESAPLRPAVRLGVAYASGDGGGSTYRTFDPLFPDIHAWHGAMSLFAWSNQSESSARLALVPLSRAEVAVEYRYVRLVAPGGPWRAGDLTTIGRATGNRESALGQEADLMATWLTPLHLEATAGYSLLVLGDGGRAIVNANQLGGLGVSHFVYAQAALRIP